MKNKPFLHAGSTSQKRPHVSPPQEFSKGSFGKWEGEPVWITTLCLQLFPPSQAICAGKDNFPCITQKFQCMLERRGRMSCSFSSLAQRDLFFIIFSLLRTMLVHGYDWLEQTQMCWRSQAGAQLLTYTRGEGPSLCFGKKDLFFLHITGIFLAQCMWKAENSKQLPKDLLQYS